MTTITLESIRAEQTRLAFMIDELEAQTAAKREQIHFPEVLIDLSAGEHYAGLIVGKDGEPSHHLILLPGEVEEIIFEAAKEWAGLQGYMSKASLPTRREQSLLYANLKEEFKPAWYWSSEEHASDSAFAWCQGFANGYQGTCITGDELRARAVRRLEI